MSTLETRIGKLENAIGKEREWGCPISVEEMRARCERKYHLLRQAASGGDEQAKAQLDRWHSRFRSWGYTQFPAESWAQLREFQPELNLPTEVPWLDQQTVVALLSELRQWMEDN